MLSRDVKFLQAGPIELRQGKPGVPLDEELLCSLNHPLSLLIRPGQLPALESG